MEPAIILVDIGHKLTAQASLTRFNPHRIEEKK